MEIGDRIKELRKALNLTQQELADNLGLKRQTVAAYEVGKIVPSDRTIWDICRVFSVDEVWLRTGVGDMFLELSPQTQLLDYVSRITKDQDAEFQRFIISLMSSLPDELWSLVEAKARDLLTQYKANNAEKPDEP